MKDAKKISEKYLGGEATMKGAKTKVKQTKGKRHETACRNNTAVLFIMMIL